MSKRHFGSVRRLPSGRYQTSYWHEGVRHLAEQTFPTKGDASGSPRIDRNGLAPRRVD